ncbi:uncharacterized protein SCHCODRAFT_02133709 [Schizophyllum commune H4-8]|uniref:uncharacterized protein n=1 Tax=Schizophyllum commune (strain H4-8 / FGSC 9210) TaxID=578458 RepID=UPI002160D141|nr:uncharacterized protein SCHCODRAFT_02133709 [Schizophyllum commune H4-8]KAI5885195.1 hypothetical protein SCHCODRAFT_02133709 [Schizophyllum commune H4-8]
MSAPTATSPCAERALSCPTTTSLPPFQPVRVPAPLTTYASLPFAPPPSLTLSSLYLPHSTLRAMTKRSGACPRANKRGCCEVDMRREGVKGNSVRIYLPLEFDSARAYICRIQLNTRLYHLYASLRASKQRASAHLPIYLSA